MACIVKVKVFQKGNKWITVRLSELQYMGDNLTNTVYL